MSTGKIDLTSKFTITYTGQIYTGREDPSKLLAALRDLIHDGTMNTDDVEVRFYGPENELLAKEIEEYGLFDIVKQYGIVPREVSFKKQRESQILLLLKLYAEYKHKGKIGYNGDIEKINKYSYREMARKFAEVLDSILGR
jgi:hypothetical protein